MPDAPMLSVVIPTCHRNDLLAKCLNRLAPGAQTLPPGCYEVVVTDDGSKTTAERMVREHYPWVKWAAGLRKGPAANRNNGAKYVRGEFLVFTDDDCLPEPGWLEGFVGAIRPEVTVYEGKTTCRDGLDLLWDEAPINLNGGPLWSCNLMIRKMTFEEMGGFDERFPYPAGEDEDFRERLLRAGHRYPFVEAACVDHPPRKRPLGRRAGERWESRVLFWYKTGAMGGDPAARRVFVHMAKYRLWQMKKAGIGVGLGRALVSLLAEAWWVGRHARGWDRKYRALYDDAQHAASGAAARKAEARP